MASAINGVRTTATFNPPQLIARTSPATLRRALSTLSNNPNIYAHPKPSSAPNTSQSYLLSYLPTTPANPTLAIGTTTTLPPTPDSLTANPEFLKHLHQTIKDHAASDPEVQSQAALYASQAGSALGSGGVFFPAHQQHRHTKRNRAQRQHGGGGGTGGDGAGGASAQGGMGGAGRAGYIHVSDTRSPPDFGRVAWPEDIFGSLEVDGKGGFVDGDGRYQESGTYRVVTNEGVLGLSGFLRGKLVERLRGLEGKAGGGGSA